VIEWLARFLSGLEPSLYRKIRSRAYRLVSAMAPFDVLERFSRDIAEFAGFDV
jgi:hypothetical protein